MANGDAGPGDRRGGRRLDRFAVWVLTTLTTAGAVFALLVGRLLGFL